MLFTTILGKGKESGPFPRDNILPHGEGRGHVAIYGHQPVTATFVE